MYAKIDVLVIFESELDIEITRNFEGNNPYYFFRANQQNANTKIYPLTQ